MQIKVLSFANASFMFEIIGKSVTFQNPMSVPHQKTQKTSRSRGKHFSTKSKLYPLPVHTKKHHYSPRSPHVTDRNYEKVI